MPLSETMPELVHTEARAVSGISRDTVSPSYVIKDRQYSTYSYTDVYGLIGPSPHTYHAHIGEFTIETFLGTRFAICMCT